MEKYWEPPEDAETISLRESINQIPRKDCKIMEYFIDAIDANYHRLMYCKKNCGYKCQKDYNLTGLIE
jgi:hypothetical protein